MKWQVSACTARWVWIRPILLYMALQREGREIRHLLALLHFVTYCQFWVHGQPAILAEGFSWIRLFCMEKGLIWGTCHGVWWVTVPGLGLFAILAFKLYTLGLMQVGRCSFVFLPNMLFGCLWWNRSSSLEYQGHLAVILAKEGGFVGAAVFNFEGYTGSSWHQMWQEKCYGINC